MSMDYDIDSLMMKELLNEFGSSTRGADMREESIHFRKISTGKKKGKKGDPTSPSGKKEKKKRRLLRIQ